MARFIDRVVLHLSAGDGGHGAASTHREKFKPLGGPDGGNGGHGGDILLEVSEGVHTLLDFHFRPHINASRGANGAGDNRNGARGEDLVLEVPVGTVVLDPDGTVLADLTQPGVRFMAAEGGFGGLGNAALATAKRKAPGFALRGEPGEQKDLVLELKSVADVGLVGFPSSGKSSLISVLSAARPKIGDYPFTTLQPNLGVVSVGNDTMTIADVPGLIPGASEGRGLGLDFLRHVERTAVLVHVVDTANIEPGRDPESDIEALEKELENYQDALDRDAALGDLRDRQRVIVLNKADLPEAQELAEFVRDDLERRFGWPVFIISAVAHQGLEPLKFKLMELVRAARKDRPKRADIPRGAVLRPGDAAAGGGQQVLRPAGAADDFQVAADPDEPGAFLVTGAKLERWIAQTDFDNDEAVGYLADRLARAGVEEALYKAGATEGAMVTIGGITFDWEPLQGAGVDPTDSARGTDARLQQRTRRTAEERKRASQARRGLIDEYQWDEEESSERHRWQG